MIGSLVWRMMGTIATHNPTQETTMTRIHPNVDSYLVNVLERYLARHKSICI